MLVLGVRGQGDDEGCLDGEREGGRVEEVPAGRERGAGGENDAGNPAFAVF